MMTKSMCAATVALAAMVGAQVVLAADPEPSRDSGIYVGLNLGQADFEFDDKFAERYRSLGGTVDTTDTAWWLTAGYRFNRVLAVELGYVDLGEIKGQADLSGTRYELTGAAAGPTVAAQVSIPISRAALYAKGGLFLGDIDYEYVSKGYVVGSSKDSENLEEFFWSIGASLSIVDHFSVAVDWAHFPVLGEEKTHDTSAKVFSVGGTYRF